MYWDNDSFFIAIDTDGISDSGATWDEYGQKQFEGPMRPEVIYYYAGGAGWYEISGWDGSAWTWIPWTDDNTYYGWRTENPNDELIADFSTLASDVLGANEIKMWAWMTRENNASIEASWPVGLPLMPDPIPVRDLATRLSMPHDPSPSIGQTEVLVTGLELSWSVAQNTSGNAYSDVSAYKLYLKELEDEEFILQGTISSWDAQTLRASWSFDSVLHDTSYLWRVDKVLINSVEIPGDVWAFSTLTVPIILTNPVHQVVESGGTAVFVVAVRSFSVPCYQWLKDGQPLYDSGNISGVLTDTLTLTNVNLSDEGDYHCVVRNSSGYGVWSANARLGIKRRIAYWPFEDRDPNSVIPGSPISIFHRDPEFVTGIAGDAMEFDNDEYNEDILYTDPNQTSYFDVCNCSMTLSCWVKSSHAATWGPFVARYGEDNQGWQLRHNGNTFDRICFTTRGTGNDDGTASNRTVYDGNWHYVTATYDGQIKKVYIDGVVSRFHNTDDGSVSREGDAATGLIFQTSSPVSLSGRVIGDASSGLIFVNDSVTACILDEVEIYNYALDAGQIAQIYANVTGNSVCLSPQIGDLDGDCRVNLNDFLILAGQWLADSSIQSIQ